jgi:hypothetical protein
MATTKTTAFLNTTLDSGVDAVFNAGKIQIRTGAAPGANAAPTGTLLWEFTLPADAFAAAASGAKGKNGTWSTTAVAGGDAAHFRLVTSADTGAATQAEARVEGSVTYTGGGGDMTIDAVGGTIGIGQTVTVTAFTLSAT